LEPLDGTGWAVLDGQIDKALRAVRSASPDPTLQTDALSTLLETLNS
jgi:hypothetical protein